jgi:2OG-Fe(II) oxygenase superfamily
MRLFKVQLGFLFTLIFLNTICCFKFPCKRTIAYPLLRISAHDKHHDPYTCFIEVPKECNVEILSNDPLVYIIRNFLSGDECQAYIERIKELEIQGNRAMTRSNPPEVSLNASKLWPLPLLSTFACIPRLLNIDWTTTITIEELGQAILPPIMVALSLTSFLAIAAVPVLQIFSNTSSRTSDAIALNDSDDISFVRALVDRVTTVTSHPWEKWEAPVVTRYEPGAIFSKHGDASPTKGSEWKDLGGQRIITCICYLNTLVEGQGGETSFDRLQLKVSPTEGSALFFYPANPTTLEAEDRTIHESLPPSQEKWIVQMFGRVGPRVPSPLGLPDKFDCKDV